MYASNVRKGPPTMSGKVTKLPGMGRAKRFPSKTKYVELGFLPLQFQSLKLLVSQKFLNETTLSVPGVIVWRFKGCTIIIAIMRKSFNVAEDASHAGDAVRFLSSSATVGRTLLTPNIHSQLQKRFTTTILLSRIDRPYCLRIHGGVGAQVESSLAFYDKVVDIWYKFLASIRSDASLTEGVGEAQLSEGMDMLTRVLDTRVKLLGGKHIATVRMFRTWSALTHFCILVSDVDLTREPSDSLNRPGPNLRLF